MSVAELVRLFNNQGNPSSFENYQVQRSPNDQNRNHQRHHRNVTSPKKIETSYSTRQKVSINRPSKAQVNNRTIRGQPSTIDSYNYSPVTQLTTRQIPHSYNHDQHRLANHQNSWLQDSFQYAIPPQEQAYDQDILYKQIALDESNTFNRNLALELQYPAEVLFNESSERYAPPHMSIIANNNFNDMELIDIQSILNRLEQDYFHTAQPYSSSVKFNKNYEDDQLLVNIGSMSPATFQRDYTRQHKTTYHQQVPTRQDFHTNDFRSYENMRSQNPFTDHQFPSVNKEKHRKRHHVHASPPIHVPEPATTMNTWTQINSECIT
ncbi:unnamed protein product [Rotaria sp. Silwood1]|nr:unnamed protein product [Rotaria sp. Silwood1]CAF1152261.1 unnamed protein product [Rotaria sp. Silwood1]CAF3441186.1 unnamed protein product [Rotaria sp. Silwood1]